MSDVEEAGEDTQQAIQEEDEPQTGDDQEPEPEAGADDQETQGDDHQGDEMNHGDGVDAEGEDGGEEKKIEIEEEEQLPENPLTDEIVAESLSLLCKTGDGIGHAFVRLDLHERGLTQINLLKSFVHLRYVDVTKNNLKDISPLSALTHMLTLKADYNLLTSARLEEMPFLQVASFSNNKIKTTEGVNHPMLEHLTLNYNEIKTITGLDPVKLTRLHTLELRGNMLESTDGVYLPNLKNLFMVNLANEITEIKELVKLKGLPLLRALVLSENQISEEDDYRLEVLITLRKLERLDKDEYTEEERNEAEEIFEQRKAEEKNDENKRKTTKTKRSYCMLLTESYNEYFKNFLYL
ncbi:hypothetical protein ACJMK2_008298 [Sinanodonta woodiana]|uniref:Leucine-rich repeat-containing protein 23 n=1 Tax=Sinanodonta woodiana TaxID=1069815 RepID=A0ABD3VLZ5_SINWO